MKEKVTEVEILDNVEAEIVPDRKSVSMFYNDLLDKRKADYSFVQTMLIIQELSVQEIIDEINEDDDTSKDEDSRKTLAQMYISKLQDMQERVLCNIGMELSKLTLFALDADIANALSPQNDCNILDRGN